MKSYPVMENLIVLVVNETLQTCARRFVRTGFNPTETNLIRSHTGKKLNDTT